jgi:hypothetical protein
MKHVKELNFDLKIAAYRHKHVETNFCVLVFVDDVDSFCFLSNDANWPIQLGHEAFVVKKPSNPPQLCVILPNVSLNVDLEEFVLDLKEQYPEVMEVMRLKNRSQQPIRTMKVELSCAKARANLLQQKELSIGYMKYRLIEYLTPAQVLICGNCCQIGHLQKNCPRNGKTKVPKMQNYSESFSRSFIYNLIDLEKLVTNIYFLFRFDRCLAEKNGKKLSDHK